MEKHNKEWFTERVGKRVFRTKSTCKCEVCAKVFESGLIIQDDLHAQYLFDCQNEMGLIYADTKKEIENLLSLKQPK